MDRLQRLMRDHANAPFPGGVEKGREYGGVDCVMADAGIYGWASSVVAGSRVPPEQRKSLEQLAAQLRQALTLFPVGARPYYEKLADLADETLRHCP